MSTSLVITIAGIVAVLYVLSVIRAVFKLRFGRAIRVPTMTAIDATWLDERWIDAARPALEQLSSLGFEFRTYLDGMSPKTSPTGMRCVAVLVNETTGDTAQIAVMERFDDRGDIEMIMLPIFTLAAGSKRVVTSNSDNPGVFVRHPNHAVQSFPMLHNVATLYSAHRAVCGRHVGAATRGDIIAPGNEVRQLNLETAEEFAYQAKRGMMKTTTAGPYEPTWRGAFYSVWKLHPRLIDGHRRRIHSRALRLLGEMGITPDPIEHVDNAAVSVDAEPLSPEMDAFIASACEEYATGNERLREEWQLDQATRWDADLTVGVVRFQFADGRTVLGDLQVLGSWSRQARSWEWAWNNPNVENAVKPDAERVREFGEKSGVSYLVAGFAPAPTIEIAAYLAAIAAKVVGVTAVIPLPPDGDADVVIFTAVSNMRGVQSTAA